MYEVTAKWREDGKIREETRNVPVRAGDWKVVDFTQSVGSSDVNAAPGPVTNGTTGSRIRSTVGSPAPSPAPAPAETRDDSRNRNPGATNPNRPQTPPPSNPKDDNPRP